MSRSEMSCNISKIAKHVGKQANRVRDLDHAADDSAPTFADYEEYANILGGSNRKNEAIGRQPQRFKRTKK